LVGQHRASPGLPVEFDANVLRSGIE